jgi:DNA repair protein RecN (Recombination protein N)
MFALNNEERVTELARLLGGSQITDSTLANAKELLIAA